MLKLLLLTLLPSVLGDNRPDPECYNGGYKPAGVTHCVCPEFYEGVRCGGVTASNSYIPSKVNKKTFNILNLNLWTRFYGQTTYKALKTAVEEHQQTYSALFEQFNYHQLVGTPKLQDENSRVDLSAINISTLERSTPQNLNPFQDAVAYWCYSLDVYKYILDFIRKENLRDTVLTVLTQHPDTDTASRSDALEAAIGFRVKVNVLWAQDTVFSDCKREEDNAVATQNLQSFSTSTGGIFVNLYPESGDDSSVKTMASRVLKTHNNPQPLVAAVFDECRTKQTIEWKGIDDSSSNYLFVFSGIGVQPDRTSYINCNLRPATTSIDGSTMIFSTNATSCTNISFLTKSSDDTTCSLQIYAVDSKEAVQVHLSFVDTQLLDSSRISALAASKLFASLHIAPADPDDTVNRVTATYVSKGNDPLQVTFTQRESVFEWVSNEPVIDTTNMCIGGDVNYLNYAINVTNKGINRIVNRYSPVLCNRHGSPVDNLVHVDDFVEEIDVADSPSTLVIQSETSSFPRSFVFGYAADIKSTTYTLARERILIDGVSSFSSFGVDVFDLKTPSPADLGLNLTTFSDNLLTKYDNKKIASDVSNPSNLSYIEELSKSSEIEKASTVLLLLNRFPAASDSVSVKDFANKDSNLFLLLSQSSLEDQLRYGSGRSGAIYDKIAAQTNGHFITCNDSIYMDDSSLTTSECNEVIDKVIMPISSKDLISSRNVKVSSSSIILPEVDLRSASSNLNVTVTISTAVNEKKPIKPSFLNLTYSDGTIKTVNLLENATSTSNIFWTTVQLKAGSEYSFHLQYLSSEKSDVFVRFWADRLVDHSSTFIDFNGAESYPDTVNGATLQFHHDNTLKSASIKITACDGSIPIKFDSEQTATSVNGQNLIHFVPFLCESRTSNCVDGTEDKYDVQVVTDKGTVHSTSFTCSESSTPTASNCEETDLDKNVLCSGLSPFKRGPTGKITDCSRKGTLIYDESRGFYASYTDHYVCSCDNDVTGDSCEIGKCTNQTSISQQQNTYTVVIVQDKTSSSYQIAADSQDFLATPDGDNIWKYRLFVYCGPDEVTALYNGHSKNDFASAYGSVGIICNNNYDSHNLTDIYKKAVEGLGQNVQGSVFILSETDNAIEVDLTEFIQASHLYQQKVFTIVAAERDITKSLNSSIIDALLTTGGFYIQSGIYEDVIVLPETFGSYFARSATAVSKIQKNVKNGFTIDLETDELALAWNVDLSDAAGCKSFGQFSYCSSSGSFSIKNSESENRVIVYSKTAVPTFWSIQSVASKYRDAVSTSGIVNKFAFSVPEGYSPSITRDSYVRIAKRENCGDASYTVYDPTGSGLYTNGLNSLSVNFVKGDKTETRHHLFGTSSTIACESGFKFDSKTGGCDCDRRHVFGRIGASCREVECSTGTPNKWNDACVCQVSAAFYGEFCEHSALQ